MLSNHLTAQQDLAAAAAIAAAAAADAPIAARTRAAATRPETRGDAGSGDTEASAE